MVAPQNAVVLGSVWERMGDALIAVCDPTVLFWNVDMKRVRTGIENSALLRTKVVERHLGIVPQFLTVNYDAHFAETLDELLTLIPKLRLGTATRKLRFPS